MQGARKKGKKELVNRPTSFPFMELFDGSPGCPTVPRPAALSDFVTFVPLWDSKEKGEP